MRNNRLMKKISMAAAVLLATSSAHAYGPLYIFDYDTGTPYVWDVSSPVKVYTDGGNYASGTVWLWVSTPETCNAENGWQCGYSEELYVEFTNEQGVARVADALASWSSVPTSSFQAEVAGSFADIGIGGADGDITGAAEEFYTDADGNLVHEVIGAVNNGGIHVLFDEDGSVMTNVMGAPFGVLGIATPEWADEETGEILEGWAVMGGANTYYNDTDLKQMGGVITHELGHAFNLAHTQTNGHVVLYGGWDTVTSGPRDCSAHWSTGGEYRLPYPQSSVPSAADMAVMYPFVNVDPNPWATSTGEHQATVDTSEDLSAISSLYPAASFASDKGTITGTVTYPFSDDGIIGVNIVARNIDNPFEDAITAMTGDWNDGVGGASQDAGDFVIQGLTPGAQYVIHAENIYSGGFPTPQVTLPGPPEYYNGVGENDDATSDDACDYTPIVVGAGETATNINIQVNGMEKAPRLIILPAPNADNITENGHRMAGTIINNYGEAQSWVRKAKDEQHVTGADTGDEVYAVVPLGAITMSDDGSVVAGRTALNSSYLPARINIKENALEILPDAGNNACDQGGGIDEYYSHFALSPDGKTMGGFLWNCDDDEDYQNFLASAATYSDADGWTVLHSHHDNSSSRVDALSNNGVAVGWATTPFGWWEGRVWMNGEEINLKEQAPANIIDVGQATAVSSDGEWVVGINTWNDLFEQRPYQYNTLTGEFEVLDISEPCPPFDWFCFGSTPFNPYDISDGGTLVGAMGSAGSSQATMVDDLLGGKQKLVDFLRAQGVMNASDLAIVSNATKITSRGKHIVGWTAVDGYWGSFKLALDHLYVCANGTTRGARYPRGIEAELARGATLGMCEADLPLQYK